MYLFFLQVWDWDKESIPLEDIGDPGPPNFIGATDKHSTDEGTINHVLVVCKVVYFKGKKRSSIYFIHTIF